MPSRVGIIGAGIAGLTLGIRLNRAGHSVALFDKGRGVGGRTSTRRGNGIAFDHGAQYFTVRDPRFRAFLDEHVPGGYTSPGTGSRVGFASPLGSGCQRTKRDDRRGKFFQRSRVD